MHNIDPFKHPTAKSETPEWALYTPTRIYFLLLILQSSQAGDQFRLPQAILVLACVTHYGNLGHVLRQISHLTRFHFPHFSG